MIKYFCDKCGKEFDKSSRPPWEPDLCPEHYEEYKKNEKQSSTYTTKPDPNLRVWY